MSSIRSEAFDKIRTFLKSLQIELRKVFLSFLIGFIGSIISLRYYIWDFFENVMRSNMPENISSEVSIITKTPFEVFLTQVKIGLIIGILLTLPIIIGIIYREFIDTDVIDMSKIPNYVIAITMVFGFCMFSAGLMYSYRVFFPIIFDFLATVTVQTGVVPSYSISSWTLFIVLLSVSFGMAAQIPILIPVLIIYNVVSYDSVKNAWRYWVLITVTIGAFLSPPDPISQMLWAIPLILLYILSLLISRIVIKMGFGTKTNKKETVADESKTDKNQNNNDSEYTGLGSNISELEVPSLDEGLLDDYYMYASVISKALRTNTIILLIIFILSLLVSFYLLFTLLTESALESFKISIQNEEVLNIISLHPVELIMFQAKLSFVISFAITIISSVVIIWPTLIKDKLTSVSRNKIVLYLLSVIALFLIFVYTSYSYIIPEMVEFLILDALRINAEISYRINRFFWMLVKVSSIIGMFISLYYAMVAGYFLNILKYDFIISKWRHVVLIIFIASILITPSGILKAFMISIPVSTSYLLSVGTIYLIRENIINRSEHSS